MIAPDARAAIECGELGESCRRIVDERRWDERRWDERLWDERLWDERIWDERLWGDWGGMKGTSK